MVKVIALCFLFAFVRVNITDAADPNLVAHWKLDESGGEVVANDSAGTNNGVISGAVWTTEGRFDGALSFDGNDYVNIGDLGVRGDWSVTFWAKSGDNSGTIYYPIGFGDSEAGIIMGGTYWMVTQHILIYDGVNLLKSTTVIETERWYHIGITKEGTHYSIYIDGKKEKIGILNDIDLTDFKIGSRPDLFGYFKGIIDDIGVWDYVLALGNIDDPAVGTINYVRINGVSGPNYGTVWNPRPHDEQTGVSTDVQLCWRTGSVQPAEEHHIYLGTDAVSVGHGTVPQSVTSEPNYSPVILNPDTIYYWRVDEVVGFEVFKGRVWSFRIRPVAASEPFPGDMSQGVASNTTLRWMPGADVAATVGHEVYFGSNINDVEKRRLFLRSDVTNNGVVDVSDLRILASYWFDCPADSNNLPDFTSDGCVDIADFVVMANEWMGGIVSRVQLDSAFYTPGELEFGKNYYWLVDESNGEDTWPGEVWSFTVGVDPPVLENAETYLFTPTYEDSGQTVHPDVLYMPGGWNGYEYWMGMTPYPYYNANAENPSILVSHDGLMWEVPPGLTNPLIDSPNPGYNADPDLVYNNDTNELWIYFLRYWSDTDLVKLTLMRSSDGLNWSEPEYLITWDLTVVDNEKSYAIVKQGANWHYWAQSFDAVNRVFYRHSIDGRN